MEELIVKTPIFDVVSADEVSEGFRPIRIKSKDWVSIIVEKDNKFLTVKQLRYGINKEMVEFPCGMVENQESSTIAAVRELCEETGYLIDPYDLKYLGFDYANPAFMTNKMHYYYINLDNVKIYKVVDKKLDEHEKLTSEWVDKSVMLDMEEMSVFMRSASYRYKNMV